MRESTRASSTTIDSPDSMTAPARDSRRVDRGCVTSGAELAPDTTTTSNSPVSGSHQHGGQVGLRELPGAVGDHLQRVPAADARGQQRR